MAAGKDIKLEGRYRASLDGNQSGTVLTVDAGATVVVKRLTIKNGDAFFGGGIDNRGVLRLYHSVVRDNNNAIQGGGIHNVGIATIVGSKVVRNTAEIGAGIVNQGGTLRLVKSIVARNTGVNDSGGGSGNAAGIWIVGGQVTLEYSAVVKNSQTFSGNGPAVGGITNFEGTLTLRHSVVLRNSASSADPGNDVGGVSNESGGTVNVFASLIALNPPNNCVGFAALACA